LAVLTTAVTVAHAVGALAFGWCWGRYGPQATLAGFAGCLAVAAVVVRQLLAETDSDLTKEAFV
jgi:hypothetical protein